MLVEEIALDVYNLKAVRTEPTQIKNFINGQFVEPIGGKYLDNVEPATGKPFSQVADSDAHDVDLAVAAAEKAFRDWSKKTVAERSNFLLRIAELIERDLPYYDPTISEEVVSKMNRFAQDVGLLTSPVPYDQVVATSFRHLWTT